MFAALALVAACSPAGNQPQPRQQEEATSKPVVAPILDTPEAKDSYSYARPLEARVTHVALDLRADFTAKRIGGTATLDVDAKPDAKEIVLDSKGLEVSAVTAADGKPLRWAIGKDDPERGAPLSVQLNGARKIRIAYRSAPNADALQWLTPEQTAGRKHPFLFSQGEPILNRSWIPTQDSPGIRQTWEARIVVPEPLKAVMSGERLTPEGEAAAGGGRAFRFRMDKPVAPYLIALAAGDIAFQSLGPRTGVYAEPATIRAAAAELVDTEKMVEAAEKLYGPYRWGRYDVIVLPPAFPYGGMENPTLTFLTPTFLAGDRSLVGLVAHELSHSWSGNLVTNAVWTDSWLNEGVTSYFENRIMEALYGKARAAQEEALSWRDMEKGLHELGATAPGTRLHDDSAGTEGGSSGIVYDKGATFLRTVERIVGRERFDAYLRSYFDRHAFQPMTSARFLADLRANLVKGDQALEAKLMLDDWVYKPGLPANAAHPDPNAFARVDSALKAFNRGGPAAAVPYGGWTTAERLRFVDGLPRQLPQARLAELDQALGLTRSGNSEVLSAWLQLAIANRYQPAIPAAEHFLMSAGRAKFVVPLFKGLMAQGDWGRAIAGPLYEKARPTYHSVTSSRVDELFKK
ncbi:MAG: leukotriene-A4 hydrolase [Sphingomonadales bacterium]|jgi:aminopeptidase N|nr:leukotriene-A4 hydrolase [Sphingomonadales bacterium]